MYLSIYVPNAALCTNRTRVVTIKFWRVLEHLAHVYITVQFPCLHSASSPLINFPHGVKISLLCLICPHLPTPVAKPMSKAELLIKEKYTPSVFIPKFKV